MILIRNNLQVPKWCMCCNWWVKKWNVLHSVSTKLIKFGLSEKHTKFEKIFLMVLTNQLIYLVRRRWGRFFQIICASQMTSIWALQWFFFTKIWNTMHLFMLYKEPSEKSCIFSFLSVTTPFAFCVIPFEPIEVQTRSGYLFRWWKIG